MDLHILYLIRQQIFKERTEYAKSVGIIKNIRGICNNGVAQSQDIRELLCEEYGNEPLLPGEQQKEEKRENRAEDTTKYFSQREITQIITHHAMWLRGKKGGQLAAFQGANLQEVDLRSCNLWGIICRGANLVNSKFMYASCHFADFADANIKGADFQGASLCSARFSNAILQNVDARSVCFKRAICQKTDFQDANLRGADLQRADLRDADLDRADTQGTKFLGAKLSGLKNE